MKNIGFFRCTALFLAASLTLPSPALALRPQLDRSGLEERLAPKLHLPADFRFKALDLRLNPRLEERLEERGASDESGSIEDIGARIVRDQQTKHRYIVKFGFQSADLPIPWPERHHPAREYAAFSIYRAFRANVVDLLIPEPQEREIFAQSLRQAGWEQVQAQDVYLERLSDDYQRTSPEVFQLDLKKVFTRAFVLAAWMGIADFREGNMAPIAGSKKPLMVLDHEYGFHPDSLNAEGFLLALCPNLLWDPPDDLDPSNLDSDRWYTLNVNFLLRRLDLQELSQTLHEIEATSFMDLQEQILARTPEHLRQEVRVSLEKLGLLQGTLRSGLRTVFNHLMNPSDSFIREHGFRYQDVQPVLSREAILEALDTSRKSGLEEMDRGAAAHQLEMTFIPMFSKAGLAARIERVDSPLRELVSGFGVRQGAESAKGVVDYVAQERLTSRQEIALWGLLVSNLWTRGHRYRARRIFDRKIMEIALHDWPSFIPTAGFLYGLMSLEIWEHTKRPRLLKEALGHFQEVQWDSSDFSGPYGSYLQHRALAEYFKAEPEGAAQTLTLIPFRILSLFPLATGVFLAVLLERWLKNPTPERTKEISYFLSLLSSISPNVRWRLSMITLLEHLFYRLRNNPKEIAIPWRLKINDLFNRWYDVGSSEAGLEEKLAEVAAITEEAAQGGRAVVVSAEALEAQPALQAIITRLTGLEERILVHGDSPAAREIFQRRPGVAWARTPAELGNALGRLVEREGMEQLTYLGGLEEAQGVRLLAQEWGLAFRAVPPRVLELLAAFVPEPLARELAAGLEEAVTIGQGA